MNISPLTRSLNLPKFIYLLSLCITYRCSATTTTLHFSQVYHGMVAAAQSYSIGGTSAITVGACSNVSPPGDLICGNGGFGIHLHSSTAPTTADVYYNSNTANFLAVGTHVMQLTISSSGFTDTLIMSLVVSPRTDPVVTSRGGTFAGCSSVTPGLYVDQEICTTDRGYPGHGPFNLPAVGSSYVDHNFGGLVTMLAPITARRVLANDATASPFNLDASIVMTTELTGAVFGTNTITGVDTWNFTRVAGCGGICQPHSLNWSQTSANKLYFFEWSDNSIRSMTLVSPPSTFNVSGPLYQYANGNQQESAGISNGGEGVPAQGDWIGWSTQGGTDHVFGVTHAGGTNPQAETYTTNYSSIAVHDQVYTVTGMSGNGVSPVHITFTPALVVNSGYPVSQVRFDNGAAGNAALNGQHCSAAYTPKGAITAFDCYGVTGNGTWAGGGTFRETCIVAGFPFPPCGRGVTMSKGADITTGKRYLVAAIDIGSGNDVTEIYSVHPGVDTALVDEGHGPQYPASPNRLAPTYNGPHCDDKAWLAGNCLYAGHQDTVEIAGHEYLVMPPGSEQPNDIGLLALANPDLMMTSAELGGGYNHVGIVQSTGCNGFCGYHIGCSVTSPTCVYSTDEDPDLFTWSVIGATNASPVRITSSPNYVGSNGDVLRIGGLGGNTALNNGECVVASLSGASFDCLGSKGNGTWTSGGKFIQDIVPPASAHQGEIILIDGTNIAKHQFGLKRLAKSRSWGIVSDATQSCYYSQPHAGISPDGRQVAWASNFGYPEQYGVVEMSSGFGRANAPIGGANRMAGVAPSPGSIFGPSLF